YLGRITADHHDWLRARTLLAEVLAEQGDTRGAIALLGAALAGTAFEIEHVPALYQYGRFLEMEGYLAQARQAYRTAMTLEPNFRDLADRMAMLGEGEVQPMRQPPVRTVTGVPVRAPLPRAATPTGIPIAPMVVLPAVVAAAAPAPTPPPKEEPVRQAEPSL